LNAAAVAAVAGIVGTVVGTAGGGFATYLATRELQESEREARARGAARILQAELGIVFRYVDLDRLAREDGERLRYPRDLPVAVSQFDRQLVASEVDANEWKAIVRALGISGQMEVFLTNDRRRPTRWLAIDNSRDS
jgi:hypothetical protein